MNNLSTVNNGVDFRALRVARVDQTDRMNKAISKLRIVEKPVIQEVANEQEQLRQDAIAKRDATQKLVAKGKEIAKELFDDSVRALIVAVLDKDDSDVQSDYFGHSTQATVVLGTSKYTSDNFREMRKHADKIDETAHLKVKPIVNKQGEEKTDENKSWWYASDEHREKYSMGGGYYLKAGHRHDSGWHIEKVHKYMDQWNESVYIGLATRLVLS